jgi:DNA-binding NtrC family response regulator
MPLLSIISTRIVAGQQLPVGSKVIVATNVDKDRAVQDLSSPTVARLNIVDLKNSTLDVRKQELLSLVDFASTMSYQEVTASKSQAVKAMNPDAVDVKMAERTSWKDMATYPKDM